MVEVWVGVGVRAVGVLTASAVFVKWRTHSSEWDGEGVEGPEER